MQHTSLNKCMSPSLLYTHGNTIINILILQIVCLLYKSHHYIICGLKGECITTNISQTIHNHNSRSRNLSPGITTALYDCFMPTNAHHITQDILLHCGDICAVYENQYIQLGGTLYSNITHLHYSKHTYNNQP